MTNLKAELKLKTCRLCSPSSVLLNETRSAPLNANAPRSFFFFHLSFFSSFFLFLNLRFPCSYSGGKMIFLPAMREVLTAIGLLGDSGSIKKRKKNAHRSVKLLKAKHWNPSVSVMSTCRTSWMFFFFFPLLLFSRDSWMNANVTCAWHLPTAFPPDQRLYPGG